MFQKNSLTVDETVSLIAHMAIYSLSYLVKKGVLPDSNARTELMNHCLLKVSGDCSFWHRSKVTMAGFELAKSTASNGHIYGQIVEAYSGNDQDLKDVVNEEISARAREVAFARNLV